MYISIKAEKKTRDGFSGKYHFHSLLQNVGVYMRELEPIPGFPSRRIYLVHRDPFWFISDDKTAEHCFLWGGVGGHMRLRTKG